MTQLYLLDAAADRRYPSPLTCAANRCARRTSARSRLAAFAASTSRRRIAAGQARGRVPRVVIMAPSPRRSSDSTRPPAGARDPPPAPRQATWRTSARREPRPRRRQSCAIRPPGRRPPSRRQRRRARGPHLGALIRRSEASSCTHSPCERHEIDERPLPRRAWDATSSRIIGGRAADDSVPPRSRLQRSDLRDDLREIARQPVDVVRVVVVKLTVRAGYA